MARRGWGIYKYVGREGVWNAEDFEGTVVNDINVEKDGADDLVTQAANIKASTIKGAMHAAETERASKAIETVPLSMQELSAPANLYIYIYPGALANFSRSKEGIKAEGDEALGAESISADES